MCLFWELGVREMLNVFIGNSEHSSDAIELGFLLL